MRTGSVDAFPPAVRQIEGSSAPQQVSQPCGEITAEHGTVPGCQRPACHQPQSDAGIRICRQSLNSFLKIEQTEVVFPTLANDNFTGFFRRVGKQAVQFTVDLALQVLGIGTNPHRRFILFCPDRCRSNIAERLADACSGFCQDNIRAINLIPWLEGS